MVNDLIQDCLSITISINLGVDVLSYYVGMVPFHRTILKLHFIKRSVQHWVAALLPYQFPFSIPCPSNHFPSGKGVSILWQHDLGSNIVVEVQGYVVCFQYLWQGLLLLWDVKTKLQRVPFLIGDMHRGVIFLSNRQVGFLIQRSRRLAFLHGLDPVLQCASQCRLKVSHPLLDRDGVPVLLTQWHDRCPVEPLTSLI